MTGRLRRMAGAAAVSLVLGGSLTGCLGGLTEETGAGAEGGTGDERPGCGQCEAEVDDARSRVAQVDGVTELTLLRYLHDEITGNSKVSVDVRSDAGSDEAAEQVAERVLRVLWESEIAPIDYVDVQVETDGFDTFGPYDFVEDDDDTRDDPELLDRWGPRPVP